MSIRSQVIVLTAIVAACVSCGRHNWSAHRPSAAFEPDPTVALRGLHQDYASGDNCRYWMSNRHPTINTSRIDKTVALGPKALAPLLDEMRRPDVTLDTFARCYSACDQILRKAGLVDFVHWLGHHIEFERQPTAHSRMVGLSLIGGFSVDFRQRQVREIVLRAKEIRIDLR